AANLSPGICLRAAEEIGSLESASVVWSHGPHALGTSCGSRTDGLLDFQRLNMAIVEEIVEPLAMQAVGGITVTVGRGGDLETVGSQTQACVVIGTGAKRRPVVAGAISAIGFFGQQDGCRRLLDHAEFVTGRFPRRQ